MNVLSIILIILLIFGIAVFFKLIKNVFKAAIYVFVLIAIILFIVGVSIYTDATNFRNSIQEKPVTFILSDNGNVIAGIKVIDFKSSDILLLKNETIKKAQDFMDNGNYNKLLDNSYKLFIFNLSLLERLNTTLEFQQFNISTKEGLLILQSSQPIHDAAEIFSSSSDITNKGYKQQIEQELELKFNSDQEFKDAVFSLFVVKLFPSQTLYIIKGMKSKEVIIYPETSMFKAVRYIPGQWIAGNKKEAEDGKP